LCSLVTSAPQMQAVMMSFSMDSDSSFQIILFCGKRTLRKTEIENRKSATGSSVSLPVCNSASAFAFCFGFYTANTKI